jgi:hypothetical protein
MPVSLLLAAALPGARKSDLNHAVTVSTVDRMTRVRWSGMKPLVDGVRTH